MGSVLVIVAYHGAMILGLLLAVAGADPGLYLFPGTAGLWWSLSGGASAYLIFHVVKAEKNRRGAALGWAVPLFPLFREATGREARRSEWLSGAVGKRAVRAVLLSLAARAVPIAASLSGSELAGIVLQIWVVLGLLAGVLALQQAVRARLPVRDRLLAVLCHLAAPDFGLLTYRHEPEV
jgi:hypothetical protein